MGISGRQRAAGVDRPEQEAGRSHRPPSPRTGRVADATVTPGGPGRTAKPRTGATDGDPGGGAPAQPRQPPSSSPEQAP